MSVWAQARGLVNQTQGYSPRGGFGTSAILASGQPVFVVVRIRGRRSRRSLGRVGGLADVGLHHLPRELQQHCRIKPTVGLISRSGIIPISFTQDSAGPFGKSVKDVALMLTAMAHHGRDEGDNATWTQPEYVAKGIDYAAAEHFSTQLDRPLEGMRLGYSDETFLRIRRCKGSTSRC